MIDVDQRTRLTYEWHGHEAEDNAIDVEGYEYS
jgi:hypothetical protein